MKKIKTIIISLFLVPLFGQAIVKYDEGALYINGVVLLQDKDKALDYYYLPQYPRISRKEDGTLEFLCIKYVGENSDGNGGLFHALVEFSLSPDVLKNLSIQLQKIVPGARIAGAVPLMQPKGNDGDNIPPSFEIVSGVLSHKEGKEAFTEAVVSSGYAPLAVGSRAAIGALLNQRGATLLWNSFTGPTSDVSVTIHGYYEAALKGYNAVVTAEMNTVYEHFSNLSTEQKKYTKKQVRDIVDELTQKSVIKIEVFDRAAGLGAKTGDMESILNIITTKLTELMFDSKSGWSVTPEKIDPSIGFDPRGRQEKKGAGKVISNLAEGISDVVGSLPVIGMFSKGKSENLNPEYVTDNQYVLKNIKDIRSRKFYLNLSKSTTIQVPIYSSGNIGGFYSNAGRDEKYFRIVNMDDPAFERRNISFQVDGEFLDAFDDVINFVTVNFRKKYNGDQDDVTDQISFTTADIKSGKTLKEISYPRLGKQTSDWLGYEYQLVWNLKGKSTTVRYPESEKNWIKTKDPFISLTLPFTKEYIELDADRELFKSGNMASANISFAATLAGEKKVVRSLIMRDADQNTTIKTALYHDRASPVVYQVKWYSVNKGELEDPIKIVNSDYLFIIPPAM